MSNSAVPPPGARSSSHRPLGDVHTCFRVDSGPKAVTVRSLHVTLRHMTSNHCLCSYQDFCIKYSIKLQENRLDAPDSPFMNGDRHPRICWDACSSAGTHRHRGARARVDVNTSAEALLCAALPLATLHNPLRSAPLHRCGDQG